MNENIPNNLANINNNNQETNQPQNKKLHNAILTVLVVGSLMLAVIGLSFAYFSASVIGNNTASSIIVNTANIGQVTFTNDNNLSLTNAFPGDSKSITFYIKSDNNSKGNYTIPYTIYWQSINNGFSTQADLLYNISCSGGGPSFDKAKQVPNSGTPEIISGNLVVNNSQVTHTCTLTVTFQETGSNQNDNQKVNFEGSIGVNLKQPYYNNANKSGTSTVPSKQ